MAFSDIVMKIQLKARNHPLRHIYTPTFFSRFYDEHEIDYMRKNWGGTVWDVGASVGKYTTVLSEHNPDSTIYAFEPNLNSLYYLGYATAKCKNVVLVPNGLTADGKPIKGTYNPDFHADSTGPMVDTISVEAAVEKFGVPTFIKMDIEGAEFDFFAKEPECLSQSTLLVSWHSPLTGKPIPELKTWKVTFLAEDITYLEPR